MANYDVLKVDGSKSGSVELNDAVFAIEPNNSVLFEAINLQRASLRQGTHAVKNRSAVRGGGRKPWRQKVQVVRQGTIRAPQWRGGGVVFGPTPRSYAYKMPKKMRRLALRSALSFKVQENSFTIVILLVLKHQNKRIQNVLTTLEQPKKVLVVTENEDVNVELSARNIPGVQVTTAQGLNVLDLTSADSVIITEAAAKKLRRCSHNGSKRCS